MTIEDDDVPKLIGIGFRVTSQEYELLQKIAKTVHQSGKLKSDSVGALAKSCLFTQINLFLQAEAKDQQYNYAIETKKQQKAQAEAAARVRSDYIPPPGSY